MYRIAIVEDDPMVAKIHEQFLASFEELKLMKILSKGKEAREWLMENEVDLIILDLFIPEINGLDLLLSLRQSKKDVDVIVVSAAKEKETIETAHRLGVYDYLIKPFSFERLAISLEVYLERKKLLTKEKVLSQERLDSLFYPGKFNPSSKQQAMSFEGLLKETESDKIPSLAEQIQGVEETKGIQKETLHYIAEYLMLLKEGKSAGELAQNLELGRVTLRRYLEFLYEQGMVSMSIEYGSVGRPKYLYRWKHRYGQYEQNKPY